MSNLDLAVIGNCSYGALVDREARVLWACLPRFDGDPVFCALLNGGEKAEEGIYVIELEGQARSEQRYLRNSAVLETRLEDNHGNAIEIIDFAPRFQQYGRTFRPMTLVRQVRPLSGSPRIRIRLKPVYDYGRRRPEITRGSNHIRYVMPAFTLRLSTDAPVSAILEETPFVLQRPLNLLLGPDESLHDGIGETARAFFEKTHAYWRGWARSLALPFEWQEAVTRAAIALKLSSFEESGAIIAAMTTSIPEAPNTRRNWDYRYCWLRDSYFVVHALNSLGATRTMEGYLHYITNLVTASEDGYLGPLFGITPSAQLEEEEVESLAGYRGMGPVRIGNDAYRQVQNDGYGSVILASAQAFFDTRVERLGDMMLFQELERLGDQALRRWDAPDAGLWELRTRAHVHTYSSVMCWAACDRLAKIAGHLGLPVREADWRQHADRIHKGIVEQAWNEELNSFTSAFGEREVDASLLLLCPLGFVKKDDPRYLGTFAQVEKQLRRGSHLLRYSAADDFGEPENAFNICTFWFIDALADVGRIDEARALFEEMLGARNHLGLLSEDLDTRSGELWGNFPQTYSMVGLIHSAMKLSKKWEEAF